MRGSKAELSVAKSGYVNSRSGWFSDRSAAYLAAGRPVITQDTGFGNILPTGEGLFAYSTLDEAAAAVEVIESDYQRHSRAAAEIANEYFDASRVLGRLVEQVGMPRLPPGLVIAPESRRPMALPAETIHAVAQAPLPVTTRVLAEDPEISVVVVTFGGLVFTRLCLESALASLDTPALELIVVDNGSSGGTPEYLQRLMESDRRVRLIRNSRNMGFGGAANLGLNAAGGQVLVILNNDTILPPDSIARLAKHLDDETIGLVGPVSNRAATEAEIDLSYATYGGLLHAAAEQAKSHAGRILELEVLTLYCAAIRRAVYEQVGPIDQGFEIGLFEDDDYSRRVRSAGYKLVCAEEVFVHHFGEGAFGALFRTGEHSRLFNLNRARYEEKWGTPWKPHARRQADRYIQTIEQIRETVRGAVPPGATVLVVSKGDDDLLRFHDQVGAHFPQVDGGVYSGHHPADSAEAINEPEKVGFQDQHFGGLSTTPTSGSISILDTAAFARLMTA